MSTFSIKPKPLSKDAFALYGDVIEASDQAQHFRINKGYTQRYHDLAQVDVSAREGRALINIFRSTPLPTPITIKVMERHPLSSQAFIPLSGQPYLVAVAPMGDFTPRAVEVFLAAQNQGINYHRGTWHHFCLALNEISDFLVIDRGGDGDNCDEIYLDTNNAIHIEFGE